MKMLRELVFVVNRYGMEEEHIPDFIKNADENSFIAQLYKGILEGKYTSDITAALDLYAKPASYPAYRMLKSRLKKRLMDCLFFLDIRQPKNSLALEEFHQTGRNITQSKLLVALGCRNIGIMLVHKLLVRAQKNHLHGIVFQCAQILRMHYSLIGMEKQFHEYDRLAEIMLRVLEDENESERLHEFLQLTYARSTSRKVEFIRLAKETIEKLAALKHQFPTERIMMNYFRVRLFYHQIEQDSISTIEVCDKAESFLSEYPQFCTKPRLAEFVLTKMVAYMHMRDYTRGEVYALRCQALLVNGSNNWQIFMEYYFLLSLYALNFVKAVYISQAVISHPRVLSAPKF